MDAYDVIIDRRMTSKMTDRRPLREELSLLLNAAVRAPTHHLTQPWRFIVLTGESLDDLGEAMAKRVEQQYSGSSDLGERMEVERLRPHRAPVIIVVVYVPSSHPKAIEVEDRYSVGAAIENMLLAAHAKGLATYWRTGPAAEDHHVRQFLNLSPAEEIAGFIYVGYASDQRGETPRESWESRTEWRGWERDRVG